MYYVSAEDSGATYYINNKVMKFPDLEHSILLNCKVMICNRRMFLLYNVNPHLTTYLLSLEVQSGVLSKVSTPDELTNRLSASLYHTSQSPRLTKAKSKSGSGQYEATIR